ncbi:MAG: hypothetical protein RLZ35_380 [Pseudomonadota bacterium]|jgi:hypothetical protein
MNPSWLKQWACCYTENKRIVSLVLNISYMNNTLSVHLTRESDPHAVPAQDIQLPAHDLVDQIKAILKYQLDYTVEGADPFLRINLFESLSMPGPASLPLTEKHYIQQYETVTARLETVAGLYARFANGVAQKQQQPMQYTKP